VITSIIALAIPPLSPRPVHAALTSHVPILINGNSGFTKPDPVNGGGSGALNDPYIIENWVIDASSADGIRIKSTTAYFIVRNCLVENGGSSYYGIYLENVINGKIKNNTVENNYYGVYLYNYSNNNTISSNIAENNHGSGIYLVFHSDSNLVVGNIVENSSNRGTVLYNSDNNLVYHNNMKNSIPQAYNGGSNYWDDGYPSGGNYWSNYAGVDNFKGENQNIPGSDGIGDTKYNVYEGGQDRYPLMNPWLNPCTGEASVSLAISGISPYLWGICKANVTVNLTINRGDNLRLRFLALNNSTIENENVIWSRTVPGSQTVNLTNLVISHDNHAPYPSDYMKRVKLVLTDNAGNVILDNMSWYKVVQDDWGNRIVSIVVNWANVPTTRDQCDF
jgi:parallel beta-helix repeat protein